WASDMVMALPKTYDATIRFGEERATDDSSGDVLRSRPVPADIEDRVRAALPSFYGVRLQTPPHMSAVKVDGRRASDRVRSGENLRLSPRPVHILSIAARQSPGSVDSWNLRIRCGKGTYVRSIARDMGRLVRCGAYVQSLVREATGSFLLEQAIGHDALVDGGSSVSRAIVPLSRLADQFYSYAADDDASAALLAGKALPLASLAFRGAGASSLGRIAVVLGTRLLSCGSVDPSGIFEPRTNILLEGEA
ncbi:MAG TPA: hypothetical protein DIC53_05695, partial [Synergistaceae bacterium]|nr:hypothetical protein [Synergistaceae bacterium]